MFIKTLYGSCANSSSSGSAHHGLTYEFNPFVSIHFKWCAHRRGWHNSTCFYLL